MAVFIVQVLLVFAFLPLSLFYLFTKINKDRENRQLQIKKKESALHSAINSVIARHISTLIRKYKILVTTDDYGVTDYSRWETEKLYFMRKVLLVEDAIVTLISELSTAKQISILPSTFEDVCNSCIDQKVREYLENNPLAQSFQDVEALNPIEFEQHCTEILKSKGWQARTTQSSNDQGIDVIAERDGLKAVFQCKKYSKPVGNAAVQEIVAGKYHEQAQIAAVVSNQEFTRSAKELASTNGVFLLHYTELGRFDDIVLESTRFATL